MMTSAMHKKINRTLHQHDWATVEEWVRTLEEIAKLNEDEIESFARRQGPARAAPAIAEANVRIAPLHAAVHAN
jgi:hypothetical protein